MSYWAFQETSQGRDMAFKMGDKLGCNATDTAKLRQCFMDATTRDLYDAGTPVSKII